MNRSEPRGHSVREEGDTIKLRPEPGAENVMEIYHDSLSREDDLIGSTASDHIGIYRRVDWQVTRNPAKFDDGEFNSETTCIIDRFTIASHS